MTKPSLVTDTSEISSQKLPQILTIVQENLANGRWERVLAQSESSLHWDGDDSALAVRRSQLEAALGQLSPEQLEADLRLRLVQDARLLRYLLRVHDTFLAHHPQVEDLRRGEHRAWEVLNAFLQQQARARLRRYAQPANRIGLGLDDLLQRAAMEILKSRYPYDVTFEAWCGRLLVNVFHRALRPSQDLCDRWPAQLSLDSLSSPGHAGDPSPRHETLEQADNPWKQWETRVYLEEALACIQSAAQRQVVVDTFFVGRPDREIAGQLGTSLGNVHVMRHRALKRLRTILESQFEWANDPLKL